MTWMCPNSPVSWDLLVQLPRILCSCRSVDSPRHRGSEYPAPFPGLWHWSDFWHVRGAGWSRAKLHVVGWGCDLPADLFISALIIWVWMYDAITALLCFQLSSLVAMAPPKTFTRQPIRCQYGSLRTPRITAEGSEPSSAQGLTWGHQVSVEAVETVVSSCIDIWLLH